MTYEQLTLNFNTVIDIDSAIERLSRKAKKLRSSAVNASTLAEKLTINKEIKNINAITFKLKMNYFILEDELRKPA
ncbi:hypothetical protein [Shewanella sp. SG41-4]|jgi:hypothetical protein|uniref:hypothetical protein n=1 Tax=Shewanella TaxID=22 RepID=UPI0016008949|nr:hypothetical protein [Shewanella sp. SG41-4]MBB1440050.1 hypothetical protein [Shewanella sp. SG41-4]